LIVNKQVTVEVPEQATELFGWDDARFSREMFEAAVVQWDDEGRISSGKSAEMLDMSRAEFLDLFFRHKVSPFQYTPEGLAAELKSA
jgi:predicted HTH domain antitoxin